MTKITGPNIAGIKEMQAYRNAYSSAAVVAMIGVVIGNFIGGTAAGAMLGDPSWFGKPFLALAGGIKLYSLAPVLISVVKYRAVAGVTQAAEVSAAAFLMISGGFGGLGLRQAHRIRKRIFGSDMHGSAHFVARHQNRSIQTEPMAEFRPATIDADTSQSPPLPPNPKLLQEPQCPLR